MRRDPFDGRPRVLDGGLATELEARGYALTTALWSARALIDAPALVAEVHRAYLDAGADVLTTAGYQASLPGLLRAGLSRADAVATLRRAVALAVDARDAHPRGASVAVVASVGPYAALRADGSEYRGRYGVSVERLAAHHRATLEALADAGADALAFETVPCVEEAEAIARALDATDGPPAWVSLSLSDASHDAQGDALARCVAAALASPRVRAVGCNCCDPALAAGAVAAMRAVTDVPIVAYPNRGDRWDDSRRAWIPRDRPRPFADHAREAMAAGATIVGGCCRTGPAEVRALRAIVPA